MYCLTGPWGDGEQQAPLLACSTLAAVIALTQEEL